MQGLGNVDLLVVVVGHALKVERIHFDPLIIALRRLYRLYLQL